MLEGSRVLECGPAPSGREPGVIVLKGLLDVRGSVVARGKRVCVCIYGCMGEKVVGWLARKHD